MAVVASVQVADIGVRRALGLLRRVPKAGSIPGLRQANVAVAAPLRSAGGGPPLPTPGRVAFISFWESDDDLSRFLEEHRIAARLAGGWHARLDPLRAFGTWPGLPEGISRSRTTEYDGPTVVLTLGRLRLPRVVRFLKTSKAAEVAATASPGMLWGTALARPPFVSTCSLWESTHAAAAYAYGQGDAGHPRAIEVDRAKPFHHQSAFVRFRPYVMAGSLGGANPLPLEVVERAHALLD
jgi:hypothetical protein